MMHNRKELIIQYSVLKQQGGLGKQEEEILERLIEDEANNAPEILPDELFGVQGLWYKGDVDPTKNDFFTMFGGYHAPTVSVSRTLDDLLGRDSKRKKDGLPKKIKFDEFLIRSKGKKKVVVIPNVDDDSFQNVDPYDLHGAGKDGVGTGSGKGKRKINPGGCEEGSNAGDDASQPDSYEEIAYDLGKSLMKYFNLPHLKPKRKKVVTREKKYELGGRDNRAGIILDKKETQKNIYKTNFQAGRIKDPANIDTSDLIIGPRDEVYRKMIPQYVKKPKALAVFIRDNSGSMDEHKTLAVRNQHLLAYSVIMYQYDRQVEPLFILHNSTAQFVPDFDAYYRMQTTGGTLVSKAYKLLNDKVKNEGMDKDYNIYVLHGTDGDNFEYDNPTFISELETTLSYANRVGFSVVKAPFEFDSTSNDIEKAIRESNIQEKYKQTLRIDSFNSRNVTDERLIEGLVKLMEENDGHSS